MAAPSETLARRLLTPNPSEARANDHGHSSGKSRSLNQFGTSQFASGIHSVYSSWTSSITPRSAEYELAEIDGQIPVQLACRLGRRRRGISDGAGQASYSTTMGVRRRAAVATCAVCGIFSHGLLWGADFRGIEGSLAPGSTGNSRHRAMAGPGGHGSS